MSPHCNRCGSDITYPPGTWPIGSCEPCELRAECERLRALAGRNVEQVGPDVHEFCKEEIQRLTDERDDARTACEKAIRERRSLEIKEDDWHRAYERREAECVTLRQALAHIQSMAGHPDAAQGCRNIIAEARAVLAGTEKP